MLIARLADTRLIKPLSAIAHHVQTAHAADPTDEVPGMGREDEIGATAHALAQARESERLAELSRRERQRAEEALRRREQRSEERRVGKEWGRTCRSRWSPYP